MTEGIDYCFIYPKDDKTSVHIKFLDGPYKDTIFKYGDFKNYIGDLLVEIMSSNMEQEVIDETGTDDFKESNLQ